MADDNADDKKAAEDPELTNLTKFLTSSSKPIEGWTLEKVAGNGANGVVLFVRRGSEKAVMKVALSAETSSSLRWEATVFKRLLHEENNEDRTRHLCRMLQYGYTSNHRGQEVSYVVMECLPNSPLNLIAQNRGHAMMAKVSEMSLQLLKAVYDLHYVGMLHRDLKPENVGLYKEKIAVCYDMGMAKIITNDDGSLRPPRGYVGLRGTDDWASLQAEIGREQGRVDDLWGWFYAMVEWSNWTSLSPLAWVAFDDRPHIRKLMKCGMYPAKIVLANCPTQFFNIQLYLRSLTPSMTPDYFYVATQLNQVRKDIKRKRPIAEKAADFARTCRLLENQYF